ncbi:MAG: Transglutaminase-like superfamily [Acidimicrobiaceae bacterium]|nr:Transglutaminase-like superfamily [Acidimicrobiaceae bacterium]
MGSLPSPRQVRARLRRLRQLQGPSEVLLFVRVVAVALAVPLFVRLPLPRQAALLAPRPRPGRAKTPGPGAGRRDPEAIDRLTRCVALAQDVGRPLVRPGCLTRGITLYWFLGRQDDEIELCFGLGHPDESPTFAGHCWLSRSGVPFLERTDPTGSFGVVYRIPAAAP